MGDTKIRWAGATWNPMTGCSRVSPGCDRCYALEVTKRFPAGFPTGFAPTFRPDRLHVPAKWRAPKVVFVNSMSDIHHESFDRDDVDAVYDAMGPLTRHQFLVLTKRPQRMARFFLGEDGYLARRGLDRVPDHVWLGTSIESDRYAFRADHLRRIPVAVRFVSAEPLIGPLPSLDLTGLAWVIIGGESGPDFRPMDLDWARDLRDRCRAAGVACFFKQSAARRTEVGIELDGERIEEYPVPASWR